MRLSIPEKTRYSPEVLATGNLEPDKSSALAVAVPGTLARLHARRGDEVRQGAPLAALESSGARASLAQAEAGIGAAKAQLALAEDALGRVTALWEKGTVPESQFVQVKGQRELAAAELAAAVAQRDQALVHLGHHTLVAPFSGVIIQAPDAVGASVGPQSPLFVIEDVRLLVLQTSFSQQEVAELHKGAKVAVVVPATGARVDDATVRLIVPSVDPATNRVPVEIAVPNAERRLLPHAFARALLPSMSERDAFRVSQSALTQDQGAFSLWMADADGKVLAVRVRVFANNADGSALVDPGPNGFPPGSRVIDSPPLGITVGQKIGPVGTDVAPLGFAAEQKPKGDHQDATR